MHEEVKGKRAYVCVCTVVAICHAIVYLVEIRVLAGAVTTTCAAVVWPATTVTGEGVIVAFTVTVVAIVTYPVEAVKVFVTVGHCAVFVFVIVVVARSGARLCRAPAPIFSRRPERAARKASFSFSDRLQREREPPGLPPQLHQFEGGA
jgi:hypothetical protein